MKGLRFAFPVNLQYAEPRYESWSQYSSACCFGTKRVKPSAAHQVPAGWQTGGNLMLLSYFSPLYSGEPTLSPG